jgi:hypothetical protein
MNLNCFPKAEGGSFQTYLLHKQEKQDKLMDLIDQWLNNKILDDGAQRVINVTLLCVQTSATRHSSMSHVLAMLLNEVDVEVISKKANRIHEMDVSHLFGSNNSFSPSGLIWDNIILCLIMLCPIIMAMLKLTKHF